MSKPLYTMAVKVFGLILMETKAELAVQNLILFIFRAKMGFYLFFINFPTKYLMSKTN